MKRLSPILALPLFLLASTACLKAEDYIFNVERDGTTKPWSDSRTWVGEPSSFPNGPGDTITYNPFGTARYLTVDQEELHVGTFSFTGALSGTAATQRLMAAPGVSASVRIDNFNVSATASNETVFLVTNSSNEGAHLSVSVGTLFVGAGSMLEIGHPGTGSLEAFNVTGSSVIEGRLDFDGVKNRAEGLNRVSLGDLTVNDKGAVTIGGRDNTGGTLAITALRGDGIVRLINRDGYNGKSGTLEINNAEGQAATFSGRILTTTRSEATTAKLAVVKKGAGTQIFSGQLNDYSGGTTIEAGVLAVTNTKGSGLGVGAVTVESGATLAGSGFLALEEEALVQSGGEVAPSAHLLDEVATLTFNGAAREAATILRMEEGSAFRFRFMDGGESDTVAFLNYTTGGLALDAAGVAVNASDLSEGSYTLFTFNHIETTELEDLTGLLRLGSGFEGYQAAFDYAENAIILNVSAIPEPNSVALGALTLLGFILWRRF